jgi:hypothetical protein
MDPRGTGAIHAWSRVKHKVTMSVLHGCRGEPSYTARVASPAWLDPNGNLQQTIFFQATLMEIVSGWKATRPGEKLPATLYLQMDRGPDMWNKTLFALVSWIVEEKK